MPTKYRCALLAVAFLCARVISLFSLETKVGTWGVGAVGSDPPLLVGALSVGVTSDPVSLRFEAGLGEADDQMVWEALVAMGYRLVVPWRLRPLVEIGLGAAGDGQRISLYPAAGIGGELSSTRLTFSLQVRTQANPFPIPFGKVDDFPVRPVAIALGLDLSILSAYR